jgi:hypothetical protein
MSNMLRSTHKKTSFEDGVRVQSFTRFLLVCELHKSGAPVSWLTTPGLLCFGVWVDFFFKMVVIG